MPSRINAWFFGAICCLTQKANILNFKQLTEHPQWTRNRDTFRDYVISIVIAHRQHKALRLSFHHQFRRNQLNREHRTEWIGLELAAIPIATIDLIEAIVGMTIQSGAIWMSGAGLAKVHSHAKTHKLLCTAKRVARGGGEGNGEHWADYRPTEASEALCVQKAHTPHYLRAFKRITKRI